MFHCIEFIFQFGPELLKFMFEGKFKGFFGDQAFIKVGLPLGEDLGLGFGHARPGQALDKGVGVEGGLRLHGAQSSD